MNHCDDVIVAGGGLSGLAAATYLARAGRRVTLLEKASAAGGRARTRERDGVFLNLGPHALFGHGAAAAVLGELSVPWQGRSPRTEGVVLDGAETFPLSLLRGGAYDLAARFDLVRLFGSLPFLDTDALAGVSFADWLDARALQGAARRTLESLVRLTSYAHAPQLQSAGAALAQLRVGMRGVVYLDGGWQTLVDGLRRAALRAGVQIELTAGVRRAVVQHGAVALDTDRGSRRARAALLAVAPAEVARLTGSEAAHDWSARAVPVRVGSLELALRRPPATPFALSLDRPLYASVHSSAARLAPAGAALVHVARYLAPGETSHEEELQDLADRVFPGWREHLMFLRYIPSLVVAHDLPQALRGGLSGRASVAIPDRPGIFVSGDWVGDEGQLADAALASARAAARAIASRLDQSAAA